MKKIPCLFSIDHEAHAATAELNPAAAFILGAESVRVTRKRDGQAMRLTENGKWLTRRAVNGNKKAPEGFILEQHDPNTGKSFGWEPVEISSVTKAFKDALSRAEGPLEPGTYELCGPKLQGNPENLEHHVLFPHGGEELEFPSLNDVPREEVKAALIPRFREFAEQGIEGVVFWVDGSPAVKIRVKDFNQEL